MNFRPDPRSRPRQGGAGAHEYLETMIRTASPAKLRLLLLERAVQVCQKIQKTATSHQDFVLGGEDYVTLMDLLSELLSGVTGQDGLSSQVADLYVFLMKHLMIAEQQNSLAALQEIQLVLETETETWRMAVAQETPVAIRPPQMGTASSGLNLQG